MVDNRSRSTGRKLRLIPPLIIAMGVLLVAAAAFFLRTPKAPEPLPPPPSAPAPAPAEALADVKPPPLTRRELIQEANAFAGYFAAGEAPPTGKDPLVGRTVSVRLAFGCKGAQVRSGGEQASIEYDAEKKALKLTARAANWTTSPLIQQLPNAQDIEAFEGFWIPHPWTLKPGCLPTTEASATPTPTPPATQTLGLGHLFEKGGSRVLRRGERPYEYVRKVPDDDTSIVSHTYWLVIEGRIVGFKSGRAIRCWSESSEHRPLCVYAVEFDRVAFEDASTGETLAEWRE